MLVRPLGKQSLVSCTRYIDLLTEGPGIQMAYFEVSHSSGIGAEEKNREMYELHSRLS